MMSTVPHVTSGLGLRKFQADGFLLTRVPIESMSLIFFWASEQATIIFVYSTNWPVLIIGVNRVYCAVRT